MRIISLNINGIRSGAEKGFFNWISSVDADFICLQEIRAQQSQLTDPIFTISGYQYYGVEAEKKGYSGVAIYSRHKPNNIVTDVGCPFMRDEGRYIQLDFGGELDFLDHKPFSIASVYLPSGSSGDIRQAVKFSVLEKYYLYLHSLYEQFRTKDHDAVVCGDLNIAHRAIDLKNWRGNQKNSGFLPEERAWMDKIIDTLGWCDAFRVCNAEPEQYTWWSNRGRAWEKNVGWRIDYQMVTPGFKAKIQSADIYKTERFSDHAPLILDYQ